MLSNRRSTLGPIGASDRNSLHPDPINRLSVCNPKPTWRRASSFSAGPPSAPSAYYDSAPPNYNSKSEHPHCQTPSVLSSTTSEIPGYTTKRTIGSIHGTTTGALPKDGVKTWVKSVMGMGAEVRNLTNLIYSMREVATERMVLDCVSRGGNAIVGLSFTQSEIMGCVTVSVQGTAVYVEVQPRGIKEERNPFES